MHSIGVQSNLKMADMINMTVAENGRIDGIEVMVIDADQSPNELVITGEHVSAEVNGMSFNLILNHISLEKPLLHSYSA